jgi:hypothetical protein
MSGRSPHGTAAPAAEQLPDVLVSGRDSRPPLSRRRAAVVVAGAVLATGVAVAQRGSTDPAVAAPVLVLRQGTAALPRVEVLPDGRLHAGLQLDVVNDGGPAVLLVSAELAPDGGWRVAVADDADTAAQSSRGRLLRTGWHATLVAHRLVDCSAAAPAGAVPAVLVLRLEADGRELEQRIDVGPGQQAYDGRIDDALQRPAGACPGAADPGPWTPPFLRLRVPSTG